MELQENKILSCPHWISVPLYLSVPCSTKAVHKHSLTNYCKLRKSQPPIISVLKAHSLWDVNLASEVELINMPPH